jgi:RimJ/RimL family protein N-acetyltransferase
MKDYQFSPELVLQGPRLTLKPLLKEELTEAAEALMSPTTWFSRTRDLGTVKKFTDYFGAILDRQQRGESLTLIARTKSGEVAGMSTYQYPSPQFRKIEIGFSWVADRYQRSFVNTEMKYLMLQHAFEQMKTNRVEFLIHPSNEKSNTAIRRLGAKFEGLLRKWRYLPGQDDGDRNIYSLLDEEWPAAKERFNKWLNDSTGAE